MTKTIIYEDVTDGSYLKVIVEDEVFALWHRHDTQRTDGGPMLDVMEIDRVYTVAVVDALTGGMLSRLRRERDGLLQAARQVLESNTLVNDYPTTVIVLEDAVAACKETGQ